MAASNATPTPSDLYSSLGLQDSGTGESPASPPVLSILATLLERTIRQNEKLQRGSRTKRGVVTVFHGSRAPSMSIRQYIERIYKYSKCSASCFVVAHVYMERFVERTGCSVTSLNVHRLLITCFLIAAKVLDDGCMNNEHCARVGGVSNAEMNKLERSLLSSLDFRVHVTLHEFHRYCLHLATNQGSGSTTDFVIERPFQIRGCFNNCYNDDPPDPQPKCAPKCISYTCRAI